MKDIEIFLKKKKKKSNDMVVNVTKIFQKMKKSLLSIKNDVRELEKHLIIIMGKYFNLEDFGFLLKKYKKILIFSLGKFLLKFKKFFKLGAKCFHFPKI